MSVQRSRVLLYLRQSDSSGASDYSLSIVVTMTMQTPRRSSLTMDRVRSRSDAGVNLRNGQDEPPMGSLTNQEREILEAYRVLDEADRVLLWSGLLTLLDQQGVGIPDEESATWDRE